MDNILILVLKIIKHLNLDKMTPVVLLFDLTSLFKD